MVKRHLFFSLILFCLSSTAVATETAVFFSPNGGCLKQVLITGSFNWTPTADNENQENLLILRDPILIQKYEERFEWMRGNG
jgi:hypothetical protein